MGSANSSLRRFAPGEQGHCLNMGRDERMNVIVPILVPVRSLEYIHGILSVRGNISTISECF